jgi:hypothetical protein
MLPMQPISSPGMILYKASDHWAHHWPEERSAGKPAMATPLSTRPQKSVKVPPTTANGDEPKKPEKKQQSITVSRFFCYGNGNLEDVKDDEPDEH